MTLGVRWIGFQGFLKESQGLIREVLFRENHSELNLGFWKRSVARQRPSEKQKSIVDLPIIQIKQSEIVVWPLRFVRAVLFEFDSCQIRPLGLALPSQSLIRLTKVIVRPDARRVQLDRTLKGSKCRHRVIRAEIEPAQVI